MFKKLDFYIIKSIFSATFVVLLGLLSIDVLANIISEVDVLGDANYSILKLIVYVLSLLPLKLVDFFPISLLIGSLMGLGKIAANNELTVMQVSGVSRLRIAVIGLILSIVLGFIILSITEFIGAPLKQSAVDMRNEALGKVSKVEKAGEFWIQNQNSFIHVGGVLASGELSDVDIYTLNDQMEFKNIKHAETALFVDKNWKLSNVKEKEISEINVKLNNYETLQWENTVDFEVIKLLISDPDDLSIRNLDKFIRYQQSNNIKPTNFLLVFWQKLFIPLTAGVMFLLALPFTFGSQRSNNQGRKLFTGVILGLTYFISYSSISNLVLLTGIPVILGALLPILVFLVISIVMLKLRN